MSDFDLHIFFFLDLWMSFCGVLPHTTLIRGVNSCVSYASIHDSPLYSSYSPTGIGSAWEPTPTAGSASDPTGRVALETSFRPRRPYNYCTRKPEKLTFGRAPFNRTFRCV